MKVEQIIKDTKDSIINIIEDKLLSIIKTQKKEEIYFHDIVFSEVDTFITSLSKKECFELIELGKSEHFDSGMIDNSSFERTMITTAYCSLEQNVYDNDFIQYLQSELNNETIDLQNAKKIQDKIFKYKEEHKEKRTAEFKDGKPVNKDKRFNNYNDSDSQIFVLFDGFELSKEDFKEPYFNDKQVLELGDGLKILTSNKKINQNAIVIEKKKENLFRIYLMDKDKDINIQDLWKSTTSQTIGSHNG